MPRHILMKLTKTKHKERLLKAAREKQQVTYMGNSIPLTVDLSVETLQFRREWKDIFKILKRKSIQSRLLYPARISLNSDGEYKALQTNVKRIWYHLTTFTTNIKRTDTVKKYKRRIKIYKINPKQLRK